VKVGEGVWQGDVQTRQGFTWQSEVRKRIFWRAWVAYGHPDRLAG
jgi:hypothetical protein